MYRACPCAGSSSHHQSCRSLTDSLERTQHSLERKAFGGSESIRQSPLALALPLSVKLAWQALDFISIPWLLGWQQAVILVWFAKP